MKSRFVKGLLIGVCGILALVIALFCAVPPKVATSPVRLTRDAGGKWHTEDGRPWQPKPAFSVQLRGAEEDTTLNSWPGFYTSGAKRFACAHIAILPKSDHLLLKRVAEGFIIDWMNQPFAREISYYPDGRIPDAGQQSPDFFLTLRLDKLSEGGPLWARRVTANVHAELRADIGGENGGDSDVVDPPTPRLQWSSDAEYQESTSALTSSSMRYQAEGISIAKQFSKSLGDTCAQLLEKFGPFPTLPATFYPKYKAPPPMAFLTKYHATPVTSTHGVLTATDANWRIAAPKTKLHDLFTEVWREMTARGWQGMRPGSGDHGMTLFKDNPVYRLTIADDGYHTSATSVVVRYQARMTNAELTKAIDALLADPSRASDSLMFFRRMTPQQQKRVIALMHTHPSDIIQDWIMISEMLKGQKRVEEARSAIKHAFVMQRICGPTADQQSRIVALAKELKLTLKLTAPLLEECGFHLMTSKGPFPALTVGVNEPALYYDPTGKSLRTLAVRITRDAGKTGESYSAGYVEQDDQGSSAGAIEGYDKCRWRIQRTGQNPPRFTITPNYTERQMID